MHLRVFAVRGRGRGLKDTPRLEESLEVGLAVELEFDLAALAPGVDRHLRGEPLLELVLPLREPRQPRRPRPRVSGALLAADERLGPAHGEAFARNIARRGEKVATILEREQRTGVAGGQCST